MINALVLIAPYFAIVLVGYLAGRRGIFKAAGLEGLNAFIFKVALPPLLFRVTMTAPQAHAEAGGYLITYALVTLAVYLAARFCAAVLHRLDRRDTALYSHLACNGNVGFLGLPLMAAALGAEAALPTALILTIDIVMIMTLTTLSLETASGKGGLGSTLRRALFSPILMATFGGMLWGFLAEEAYGLTLAEPVARFLDTLGQAAIPAALFATGATLAHHKLDRHVMELGSISLWKLVLHPLAVFIAFTVFVPDLPPLWLAAGVLAASLPCSNNAVLFASVYGSYQARASAVVLITTALSILSFAAILSFLKV